MALKFLNKKGWHTGSLRNIENVWKAEQKHEAEQKKLDELRKQIHEERERSEFRLLQEQAGLVPRQERLEFLYDSGLAVGKGNSSGIGFKALESSAQKNDSGSAPPSSSASSSKQQQSVPGALFEEKSQSASDAWRKLHSDPLLLIRQREQEALARVKNNPVQMAMIRKSVEAAKSKGKKHGKDDDDESKINHHHHHKRHEKHSSSRSHSDSVKASSKDNEQRRTRHHDGSYYGKSRSLAAETKDEGTERRRYSDKECSYKEKRSDLRDPVARKHDGRRIKEVNHGDEGQEGAPHIYKDRKRQFDSSDTTERNKSLNKRPKLSDEERAAKLREMQMDAELHEEQRFKRIKKADESDAQEAAVQSQSSRGRNFLDGFQKSIYGTDKGGSSTIEESVRRRTHYSQSRSESTDRNAFRR